MKKRIVAIMAAMTMTLGLVACGGNSAKSESTGSSSGGGRRMQAHRHQKVAVKAVLRFREMDLFSKLFR